MQASGTSLHLPQKTWQLGTRNGVEGYLYHCILCDEALVLSKILINPRKIMLAFNDTCPGCGFELDRVLDCQTSVLPAGRRLLTNLKCADTTSLLEQEVQTEPSARRGSSLERDSQSTITTGIDAIDRTLFLKSGQLVFLQGEPSNTLSLLICVRATLPAPRGFDSNIVFIDAGNSYDSYTISLHATSFGLFSSRVEEHIHLSRAFTHHQVHNLIVEKLPGDIREYNVRLAVVSDITALFCDPDVRNRKESFDLFNESIRVLAKTADEKNVLILATNKKSRNRKMEDRLTQTAQVTAILKDKGAYTHLTIARNQFAPECKHETVLDNQTLTEIFR